MSDSPTPVFLCDCEEWMRDACDGEPFYQTGEGKRYCVLHFPAKGKSADFEKALQRKLENKDFNFRGVWFPDELSLPNFDFGCDADFRSATFNANANFIAATFSAQAYFFKATFNGEASFANTDFCAQADFYSATFDSEADFRGATFSNVEFRRANFAAGANFRYATFSAKANFISATFSGNTDYYSATFKEEADLSSAIFWLSVDFTGATFIAQADFMGASFHAETKFNSAAFGGAVRFAALPSSPMFGGTSSLDLQFARVDKPDQVSFHSVHLRPHWFVNIDARKFDFTNVEWDWRTIGKEIETLQTRGGSSSHRLLAIVCRHLAVNAEENHRYEEASKFRYMAMDARRREVWRGFALWKLSWWYWLASGYGERVTQAFLMLLGIMLLSALLYNHVGFARWEPRLTSESDVASAKRDDVGVPLKFSRAMTYSAGVMTLQKPEPRPATPAAQAIVLLETIIGPVQAALLALAIRRKFMR